MNETTIDRYYLKADHEREWSNVTKAQFIAAEQAAGFHSKFGPNHLATGGFSGRGIRGRVETVPVEADIAEHEQPAPEGEEWRVHRNKREVVNERGFYVAFTTDEPTAEQIVRDHRLAALVPGLVEALTTMTDKFYPHQCKFHGPQICDRCEALRQASSVLNTVAKAREG